MPFDFPTQPRKERPDAPKPGRNLPVVSDPQVIKLTSMLDQISVASPCDASWEDMSGDEQVRFCGMCTKNVYNFSDMTRPQIATLLMTTEGRVCGRFFKRADGTLLTADCPIGVAERAYRMARRQLLAGMAFVAVLISSLFGLFGSSRGEQLMEKVKHIQQVQGELEYPVAGGLREMPIPQVEPIEMKGDIAFEPEEVMGGIAYEPELQQPELQKQELQQPAVE